jgi:hypothetical protein
VGRDLVPAKNDRPATLHHLPPPSAFSIWWPKRTVNVRSSATTSFEVRPRMTPLAD